jgi:hypothetical protein
VDDVRLDAFGRLVQNQQRRLEHERTADRQLLLLPPDRSPPRRRSICFSTETVEDLGGIP